MMTRADCYSKDRLEAIASFIVDRYGFEVPLNWADLTCEFVEDTETRLPAHQRAKYYKDGGSAWPDRFILRWSH